MFIEFPGATGGPVYIDSDCVAQIDINYSPHPTPSGIFFHDINVVFKPEHQGLDLINHFVVDYDHLSDYEDYLRHCLKLPEPTDWPEKPAE